jgi:hypothetical protein
MKRLTLVLLVPACLIGTAHADVPAPRVDVLTRLARAAVVVPVEWDGTWTTVDSVYTCPAVLQSTGTSTDTICGGKNYAPDTQGLPITYTCSGTATATTLDLTCTASEGVALCTANYTTVLHGTRTGDSYHIVVTLNLTYSGTAPECNLLPPTCIQVDSWGTRTGPAPSDFCATSTRKSTWGRLKTVYR